MQSAEASARAVAVSMGVLLRIRPEQITEAFGGEYEMAVARAMLRMFQARNEVRKFKPTKLAMFGVDPNVIREGLHGLYKRGFVDYGNNGRREDNTLYEPTAKFVQTALAAVA